MFIQPKSAYPLPFVLTTLFATLFLPVCKSNPSNKFESAALPDVLNFPANAVVIVPAKSESSFKDAAISFNVSKASGAESTTA